MFWLALACPSPHDAFTSMIAQHFHMPWYSIPNLHSISDSYPICHHFLTTTMHGWACMHRIHHYPTWMLTFDCIAFCIYVHRYPIRSLSFVSVILHGHLAFTCTTIPYGCYVSSPLSFTDIAFCVHRYPMRMLHLLCYPIRMIPFVYIVILCGCYVLLRLSYIVQCILHDYVFHDLI